MRTWLKKLIVRLEDLRRHPDPDLDDLEWCAEVVRDAADKAAQAGHLAFYDEHKYVQICSPRDAVAVLSSLLATLQPVAGKPADAPLTVAEAAERYGIAKRTVYALCEDGQLAHHRVGTGRGTIRIKPADFDRYLSQCRVDLHSDKPEDFLFGSPAQT